MVMAGLDPAIHAFLTPENVDGRDKPGGAGCWAYAHIHLALLLTKRADPACYRSKKFEEKRR